MLEYEYIILGGGVAGGYAVKELVDQGAKPGDIALISGDDVLPYERPPLSKKFLLGEKKPSEILINPERFYKKKGIDVHLKTRIWRVDFYKRCLTPKGGEDFRFGKLLLATGSQVRMLDVPGAELDGLFYLRWLHDAQQIREAAQSGGPAVVIGGGYIGLEVSAHLAQCGLETTLLVNSDRLLDRLFTQKMSDFFEEYFRNRGVTIRRHTTAAALEGQERVEGVRLESGEVLPAAFAVAGVGVEPVVEMYRNTKVQVEGGVFVDEYLETDVPGVYAAGDITCYPDPVEGGRRRVEHWDNAVQQGRVAARNMAGDKTAFDHVPYFFSDVFDLSWEFWGDAAAAEQIVYRGEVGSGSFSTWWLKEGRLSGAFVMNRPEAERELAPRWIRERKEFAPGELEGDEAFSAVSADH